MRFLVLFLVGGALSLPHGFQFDQYNPHHHSKFTPLGYGYLQDPLALSSVYRLTPQQHQVWAKSGAVQEHKMIGEQFFKHPHHHGDGGEVEETREEVPYSVVQDFGSYEDREYPAAKYACVKSEVDNAVDPLAGLEKMNPFAIMMSNRWWKLPASIMFKELFKYISGVNQAGEEIEMTRPVITQHSIKQKQFGGDLEVQEMCFYLPAKHQANPPQPLAISPVYIYERPTMRVYARRFGGFPLTAEAWEAERKQLETDLVGKPHHDTEYYTVGYNSPHIQTNRRNEVWIQCLEAGAPVIAAAEAEEEEEEKEAVAEIVAEVVAEVGNEVIAEEVAAEEVTAEEVAAEEVVAKEVAAEEVKTEDGVTKEEVKDEAALKE